MNKETNVALRESPAPENKSQRKASKAKQPFFMLSKEEGCDSLKLSDGVDDLSERLHKATGSENDVIARVELSSSVKAAVPFGKQNIESTLDYSNSVSLTMEALAPQDEIEGHLVSQLAVLQQHSMYWLMKAINTERVDFANIYMNGASKMLARHHETIETLMRYRRRGEQRVHVEHVHVHEGGQAIVGNVSTGEGLNKKVAEGPHAKV
jgi:hypothetical protein